MLVKARHQETKTFVLDRMLDESTTQEQMYEGAHMPQRLQCQHAGDANIISIISRWHISAPKHTHSTCCCHSFWHAILASVK